MNLINKNKRRKLIFLPKYLYITVKYIDLWTN